MIKKILPCLLALAVMLSALSACSKNTEPESSAPAITQETTQIVPDSTSFKLSYSKSDSLNPYESETLNNQIVQNLVYESLFIMDESYEAQPALASSYSYENSTTLVVTIPSGMEFSDGSRLDADSVVYSFNRAKSSPHWKNSLAPISSASAESPTVIRFNLSYADLNAHNLLTFAVTNGNTEAGYLIGSGRYKFTEGDGNVYLDVNEKHNGFNPRFTRITLISITSSESIENAINIGNISYAFRDMSTGSKTKMQCNKKAVNMNNLVYIGVNSKSGITSNEYIRKAISLAADRETLVKSAYRGYAKSATSVFNPASAAGKETAVFSAEADLTAAKQAISQSGYSSDKLTLSILTSDSEGKYAVAQLLKQQLEAAGFKVTIDKQSASKYKSKVNSESFSIYIGESKIPNDMNLYSFLAKKGSTSSGIDFKGLETYDSYWGYLAGENEVGKFILDFSNEMPFIPLLYRQGMICYSKSMHGDMQGYEGNYFSNIEDWYFN